MILLVIFQCFVPKFLIIDIYSLTSEKQNITLVLLTLSAAMCNETMCLYCWTEFLTGVLVYNHPYCLCVDLSGKGSLEAGRWFQSNCFGHSWQDSSWDSSLPVYSVYSAPSFSVPPSTRHHNCAQCCDMQCCSDELSPTYSCCNCSKGGEDEHCFPTSNGLIAQICPRPGTHRSGNHFT